MQDATFTDAGISVDKIMGEVAPDPIKVQPPNEGELAVINEAENSNRRSSPEDG